MAEIRNLSKHSWVEVDYRLSPVIVSSLLKELGQPDHKAWFPLSQLRPRQRPISSQNKAINVKHDCSTL